MKLILLYRHVGTMDDGYSLALGGLCGPQIATNSLQGADYTRGGGLLCSLLGYKIEAAAARRPPSTTDRGTIEKKTIGVLARN